MKKKELNWFKFMACIHPKHGGDDYIIEGELRAKNEKDAKRYIEAHLKKKSAVVDYKILDQGGE